MKKLPALFFYIFLSLAAVAQSDTCRLRISLLTCGPGEDLYSIWGHTGVRVIDSALQTDVVFNYGTFDDSDPLFYLKFTRGMMMYSVSPYTFSDFMAEYRYFKRSVTEQVLQLDCAEKIKLQSALWTNTKEENKFYAYHFYADNCTTRARDIILNNLHSTPQFGDIRPRPGISTYRQLIHSFMTSSGQAWNKFAIDVLLGNHLDEIMNNQQAMFLPDFLMKGVDNASVNHLPLAAETTVLLANGQPAQGSFFTPVFLFSMVLVVMVALSFAKNNTAAKALVVLDSLFFLLIGLLGLLMLVLWIFRIDNVCRNNFNLAWALPTHIIIAFAVNKQKNWVKNYWLFTAIASAVLLLAWKWLPQEMNNSILLIVAIVLFRSIVRFNKIRKA
ncbi:MAG: DUF4105 domain-containing protein [Chitinophagaceae bacterium]